LNSTFGFRIILAPNYLLMTLIKISIMRGVTKMYHDLKATYWWYGMKRDVAEYVALCDT
jgi:hypothetical protein